MAFNCSVASFARSPSSNMVRQKGQAVPTTSGFTRSASSVRSIFTRLPMRSSNHIIPPPAPQQKPFSRFRSISLGWTPGRIWRISRGAS